MEKAVDLDEKELDRLYALPPEEFTAARNELAKSLRDEGRRDEAEVVRSLQRPSVGAWVLNQLARTRPTEIRSLVEAGKELRKVQASGKGDLRAATQAERAAVAEILGHARAILEESGRTPSEATLQPVRTTLAAAAADPDAAAQLREGRLARELEPPAFGGLLGHPPRRPPGARKKAATASTKAEERKALQRELSEARARVSTARRRADAARRQAERLKREWEGSQQDADSAKARLAEAEASLKALEQGPRAS